MIKKLLLCHKSLNFFLIRKFLDDYNRVVLDLQAGIPDSDYVNGSYVDVSLKRELCLFAQRVMIYCYCCVYVEYTQTKCLRGDSGT